MSKQDSTEQASPHRPAGAAGSDLAPAQGRPPGSPVEAQSADSSATQSPDDQDEKKKMVLHRDVLELSEDLQALAKNMLIQGATIEDTFDALNEQPGGMITLQAVLNFYRSRVDLQRERIQKQAELARALKEALGNPESGFNELADAILMTGLMRERRYGKFGELQAMRESRDRQMLVWDRRLKHAHERLAGARRKYIEAQTHTELVKAERLEKEGSRLDSLLKPAEEGRKLDPEAYQQIREIYGLLTQPAPTAKPENSGS